jgi:nucleoside 2-deoxyribosyltransferase
MDHDYMRVYLSSSFVRRAELRQYKRELERAGYVVTSRWLYQADEDDFRNPQAARATARRDLADIERSDLMLLFYGATSTNRGGVAAELGYAIARDIPVWLVCSHPQEFTIFGLLGERAYANWESCKAAMIRNDDYEAWLAEVESELRQLQARVSQHLEDHEHERDAT